MRARFVVMSLVALCVTVGVLAAASTAAWAGTRYGLVGSFGKEGAGAGEFAAPAGVAVDQSSGDVYVVDSANARVQKFEAGGAYVSQFDGSETPATAFSSPSAVAVDSSTNPFDASVGDVYVVDAGNNVVDKFTSAGVYVGQLTGTAAGAFSEIKGVAVDGNGNVWVSEASGEVAEFASNTANSFVTGWNTNQGAGQGGLAVGPSGTVYVTVGWGGVFRYTAAGSELAVPGTESAVVDFGFATGVAVDPASGNVFVDDGFQVNEYEASGTALPPSFGSGVLSSGQGIAADDADGHVYVADAAAEQIDLFRPLTVPDAATDGAVASATTATLAGMVDAAGGPEAQCSFEYGTEESYGQSAPCEPAGPFSGPEAVRAHITGLSAGTTYHYRLHATSSEGESNGADRTFATSGQPQIESVKLAEVGSDNARLSAVVNPSSAATAYRFQYTTQADYEANGFANAAKAPVPDESIGAGPSGVAVSQPIAGLQPDTVYVFQVVAENEIGSASSEVKSLKTFALPRPAAQGRFPGQGFLPDGRAWEMVSPPDKNGGDVLPDSFRSIAADNGDAFKFSSLSAFADAMGTGIATDYMAMRAGVPNTPGWTTHAITPRQNPQPASYATAWEPEYVSSMSPDLSRGIFESFSPVPTPDGSHPMVANFPNLYLRTDLTSPGAGSYLLLSDCPGCASPMPLSSNSFEYKPHVAEANGGDGQHEAFTNVIYESELSLTFDAPESGTKLYEGTVHATDDVQQVAVDATAGDFRLSLGGETTADIPFDAPAAGAGSVAAALEGLPSIGAGNVTVVGGPGDAGASNPYVVTFAGRLAEADVPQLAGSSGSTPLTGGAAAVTISTRLPGGQHVRLASRIPVAPATSCNDEGAPECVPADGIAGSGLGVSRGFFSLHAISNDGSTVVFREPGTGALYLREHGSRTAQINVDETTVPTAPAPAQFWTASADGKRIFFSTKQKLVDGDTNRTEDLYMYDATKPASATDKLTLISQGGTESGRVQGVIGASDDGKYVYFASGSAFVAQALRGNQNLYLWHDGSFEYLGYFLSGSAVEPNTPAIGHSKREKVEGDTGRVAPDGMHLLFMTPSSEGFVGVGGYKGFDHGTSCIHETAQACRELLVYSADTHKLRCASCSPSGVALSPLGDAHSTERHLVFEAESNDYLSHALSDDGRFVFFETGERLVPEDTNNQVDVYEYDVQTEEQHLISSGTSSAPSYFLDASADGHDVFFETEQQLSGWDVDRGYDVYDARMGGGFPEPPPPPESCQGDACQPAAPQLFDATPASAVFDGPASRAPSSKPRSSRPVGCPSARSRWRTKARRLACRKARRHKRGRGKRKGAK
jgi:hypothetical protein